MTAPAPSATAPRYTSPISPFGAVRPDPADDRKNPAGIRYGRLAAALEGTWQATGSFLEVGVAYVRFAIENRSHFEVMFRPELVHRDDAALNAARNASSARLYGPLEAAGTEDASWDPRGGAVAAWSLVHGFATLWLNGSLPPDVGEDPDAAARRIASYLFRPMPDGMDRRDAPGSHDP